MPQSMLAGGKRSRKRGSRRNKGIKSRKQRGGAGAAEYMVDTFGSDYSQQVGKVITSNMAGSPTPEQLMRIQAGGKRRRTKGQRRSRSRRGGNIGAILSNAAPSLALLGLTYRYGKKRR